MKILELPLPEHGRLAETEAYYARLGVQVGWRPRGQRPVRMCRECGRSYDPIQFRATRVTKNKVVLRAKVCLKCEEKDPAQLPMTCHVCHKCTTRDQAPKGTCRPCRQATRPRHTSLPKTCRECLRKLPTEAFSVNPSGYRKFRCKECIERQLAPGGKKCPGCHTFKEFDAYSIHRRATDGRKTLCRSCESASAGPPPWSRGVSAKKAT